MPDDPYWSPSIWSNATVQTTGPGLTLDSIMAALEELESAPVVPPPLEICVSEHVPRGCRVWIAEHRVAVNREDRDELSLEELLVLICKPEPLPVDDMET